MQKWEYLVIRLDWGNSTLHINGEKHPVMTEEGVEAFAAALLNDYGEQGWELVQSANSRDIFKRPK
jgi:hypothetical protein